MGDSPEVFECQCSYWEWISIPHAFHVAAKTIAAVHVVTLTPLLICLDTILSSYSNYFLVVRGEPDLWYYAQ